MLFKTIRHTVCDDFEKTSKILSFYEKE